MAAGEGALNLSTQAQQLGEALLSRGLKVTTAESCTGGGIACTITDIAGSSAWFERGFVTYSNAAKSEMLGVDPALIEREGAVSEAVVVAMARGACAASGNDLGVAVSGVAGPGGGSPEKPVGTVWLACYLATADKACSRLLQLEGDRLTVRRQTIAAALQECLALLDVTQA
ncbi:damage-inducible protein CinA [Oceanisphaera psychrotolerans]|uniref:Damage-inducible protein CinA n=1 Tax=Oceanisphaera psychrotolerans TaxID=1414654 RepID=A0A1J4QIG9_9GAMM|nr:nicotinamide-nucleotide amidohydrolase family protein [Oceanisphaera psychrotolerans]OIN12302.1 damage-inducible protein CinA [Oceanisphaera psychrotolerans]